MPRPAPFETHDPQQLAEKRFWLERLTTIPSVTTLRPDRLTPPVSREASAQTTLVFEAESVERLRKITRGSPLLTYSAVLTAVCVSLSRRTGQSTVVVGTPALAQLAEKNAVTFWLDVDLRGSFREALEATRARLIEIYAHQRYPVALAARDLGPSHAARGAPFSISVASTSLHGELPSLNLDLALLLHTARELSIEARYRSDRYRASTMTNLLEQVQRALVFGLADLERPIGDGSCLTDEERRRIVVDWNATSDIEGERCGAHELFERQVMRSPNAVALRWAEGRCTYRELDLGADRVAERLQRQGVGVEDRVGLYLNRSPELVAGLIGVLKTGAAYVPLDPAYPDERLSYVMSDAGLTCVVTHARLRDRLKWQGQVVEIDIDDGRHHGPALRCRTRPQHERALAYVLYTSGSTGRPKGVAIEHRGLTNYLCWARDAYQAARGNGAPLHTTAGFDLTVTSLLVPLISGTSVELIEESLGVQALADTLRLDRDYSLVKLTPTHLELLRAALGDGVSTLTARLLVVGGEALSGDLVAWWRRLAPETRIVNEYGPTETVVGSCTYEVPPGVDAAGAVPIGRPIANTRLYVLDERREPVGVGVEGELYICGFGVARGYVGRPDLTAERFVPDHVSGEAGARLYRTGDYARWDEDGILEYVGRRDTQVKVRGYRVELDEVARALEKLPEVRVAAAAVWDGRLVGYIVWNGSASRSWSSVRDALQQSLPDYLIPSAWCALADLPASAHGKLDRSRLPMPTETTAVELSSEAAPRTQTESTLAAIWADVLGCARIGLHDNFFELGGHSLLATRLLSRVREAFPVDVPLRRVFDAPTVAAFAEVVEHGMARDMLRLAEPERVTRDAPLPLSFAQERLWWHERLFADACLYNIPIAVRLRTSLNIAALERSLNEIVHRHELLRTAYTWQDGRAIQSIAPELQIALPVRDLTHLPIEEREAAALDAISMDATKSFDLSQGPVLRAMLLRLAADDHILGLVVHHIASDAWSVSVMAQELGTCYQAYAQGVTPGLPELPLQYADYAAWERSTVGSAQMVEGIQYWVAELRDAEAHVTFPPDRDRLPSRSYNGRRFSFALPAPARSAVKRIAQRCRATTFMTLLAAFQALLYRYTGAPDICVGTPIVNRNSRLLEPLIGCFTNTLVIRADLSNDPPFVALLAKVRETTLAAYAHRQVPFDRVVEAINPLRDERYHPLFQVMFTHRIVAPPPFLGQGVEVTPLRPEAFNAKCDLTCHVAESANSATVTFEYNADLYDESTIGRLAADFSQLAESMCANPEVRLGDALSLMGDTEIAPPAAPPPRAVSAAQRRGVVRDVAVACQGEVLTYAALSRSVAEAAGELPAWTVHSVLENGSGAPCTADVVRLLAALGGHAGRGIDDVSTSASEPGWRHMIAAQVDAFSTVHTLGPSDVVLCALPSLQLAIPGIVWATGACAALILATDRASAPAPAIRPTVVLCDSRFLEANRQWLLDGGPTIVCICGSLDGRPSLHVPEDAEDVSCFTGLAEYSAVALLRCSDPGRRERTRVWPATGAVVLEVVDARLLPVRLGGIGRLRLRMTDDSGAGEAILLNTLARRVQGGAELLASHELRVYGGRLGPPRDEVVVVLKQHPAVLEAVVLTRTVAPGARHRFVYVQPHQGATLTAIELRRYLSERLPAALLPRAVYVLRSIPFTADATVDEASLDGMVSECLDRYEPPPAHAAGLESSIAEIWGDVLGTASIGPDDNFFDAGGHSLLLVTVVDQLRQRTGFTVTILDLLRYTTVRALAAHLTTGDQHTDASAERVARRTALAGLRHSSI